MKHQEYNGINKGRFNRATTSEEEIERMFNKAVLQCGIPEKCLLDNGPDYRQNLPLMTYNGMCKGRLLGKGLEPSLEGGK